MMQDKEKSGSAVLDVSRKVYETSLVLYPEELREEFGEEMVEVFEEQVADAYQEHGVRGVLAVWWCAAREFIHIALASQVAERVAPVIGVVTAFALMLWLAGFMVTPVVMDKACGR